MTEPNDALDGDHHPRSRTVKVRPNPPIIPPPSTESPINEPGKERTLMTATHDVSARLGAPNVRAGTTVTEVTFDSLREAAGAAEGDTITIGPDGTVGRLEKAKGCNAPLYYVVVDDPDAPKVCSNCGGAGPKWLNGDNTHGCHVCSGPTDSDTVLRWYGGA